MPRSASNANRRAPGAPATEELSYIEAARRKSAARRRLAASAALPNVAAPRPQRAAPSSKLVEALEPRSLLSASWVVATWGNDANAGTLAAPFQSIERAAEVASPGDTVYVRGGTYHETIRPWNSGTASAPITFAPYGGESVTIDGADPVAGWDGSGAPIFTTQLPWDLGSGNNEVFVDGQAMNEARWPNTGLDLSHPTLATADGASASAGSNVATIYDASLTQPAGFWIGGAIHISAGQGWVAQTGTITDSRPGQVSFTYSNNGSYETPQAGNRYYLTGKPGALDAAGEWALSNGQLSLWTPSGDSPNNHAVEVKHRAFAFDLAGLSNINIDGFNLFASTINTDARSSNIVINGITAKYLSQFTSMPNGWTWQMQSGIVLYGPNDVLKNSEIANSPGDGVFVHGAGSVVSNNIIHDIDTAGGDGAGVHILGANVTVDHNTIYNTGRDGILIGAPQAHVLNNIVHDFGLQTTDVGAIYTVSLNGQGSEIAYNQVYNGSTGGFGSAGLYLDNNSSNFVVDHNITWGVTTGMRLNLTSRNELVYNNTLDGIQSSVDKTWGAYDWSGTAFKNNIFLLPTAFGANLIAANNWGGSPGFVNAAAHDYRLVSGSRAIDVGLQLGQYTATYAGTAPDIGAVEYGLAQQSIGAAAVGKTVTVPPVTPVPVSQPPVIAPPIVTPATSIDARAGINALAINGQTGPARESFGGLGYLYPGNYVQYNSINFGSSVSTVTFQLAVTAKCSNQRIELRLDGIKGKVIGTLITRSSGGWSTYTLQSTAVAGATGVHNLFLTFVGTPGFGMGNIKTIKFS